MELHIFFLPMLTPGHLLPMVDMARLFADRGVRATIVTTPSNATNVRSGPNLNILTIPFSSAFTGLPDGVENLTSLPTPEIPPAFVKALDLLESPFRKLLSDHHPDCIISDIFYSWSSDVAAEFGIPRLVFQGMGFFSLILTGILSQLKTHETVTGDDEPFIVPMIPHEIKLMRSELPTYILKPNDDIHRMAKTQGKSYGMVMNTFHELEAEYVELLKMSWHMRVWLVGPVSLCNQGLLDHGSEAPAHVSDQCLKWLDSKEPGSVLYVCFGSLGKFTAMQMHEMASGLLGSGHQFIWVVKSSGETPVVDEEKGLVVNGWAPQVLILNHPSVGGFMTHCGWNSSLEGITAGVPMITWPLFAEQFFNEKLIVEVLRVGVSVGFKQCCMDMERRVVVKGEVIEVAVKRLMGGEVEAVERKKRAKELSKMAKMAVGQGGSSHSDTSALIQELVDLKANKAKTA
ncbi:UDP-glucuronosyl/UDP-glucosyltransferase protein [Dioscorea alata]|uniref:UDP-glucuronosyl/UDP-glucosyltransferase protein n=1 Tax=Dioscorea alata TaxID=55571 RepID=A0ACB7W545_DIOAL|nr:UDP-glucuronosyl/UDP-glucosyltransferase protein [Dioscorea alata]